MITVIVSNNFLYSELDPPSVSEQQQQQQQQQQQNKTLQKYGSAASWTANAAVLPAMCTWSCRWNYETTRIWVLPLNCCS